MSETLDELLDALEHALALIKERPEGRFRDDAENLLRVKRVLEGLDPEEIDALLEDDEDEEEEEEEEENKRSDEDPDDEEEDDEDDDE